MSLLSEKFSKVDKVLGKKENLLLEKEMIENTYKDNEILQKYIKVLKSIEKIEKEDKANKDTLYDLMMEEDVDCLDGKNCQVTLKKPYIKKEFDLKGFTNRYYNDICKAKIEPVLETIKMASEQTHVEITTLMVSDENDSVEEIVEIAKFIASIDKNIPLHLSRYFPKYKMKGNI